MAGCNGKPAQERSRRIDAGFTLVELIAAIAIVAILAAFAVPQFEGNRAFAERGYADELASGLRLARAVSVASGCDVRFSINNGGYQALQRAAGSPCQAAGAFVTNVRRGDGTNVAGWPPANANVPVGTVTSFVFVGGKGNVSGGAPPATVVGPFSVTVDADGWVQVQ